MSLEQQPVEPLSVQLEAAPRVPELAEAVALEHADRALVLGSRDGLDAQQAMLAEGRLQAQRHGARSDAAAAVASPGSSLQPVKATSELGLMLSSQAS